MDPHGNLLDFPDRSCYYFFLVDPQLYSRGWVDPVPDPLLLRKSGRAVNRIQNLWICSQEPWPLDHRGGHLIPCCFKQIIIGCFVLSPGHVSLERSWNPSSCLRNRPAKNVWIEGQPAKIPQLHLYQRSRNRLDTGSYTASLMHTAPHPGTAEKAEQNREAWSQ
jgi:hypothetical protein